MGASAPDAVAGAFSEGEAAAGGAVAVSSAMCAVVPTSVLSERCGKSGDVMSETVFAPRREQKDLKWADRPRWERVYRVQMAKSGKTDVILSRGVMKESCSVIGIDARKVPLP